MRIALHEPDMPGNAGAVLRLSACFGVAVDIIEPCGFAFSDRALKRAGMDYADLAQWTRHADWAAFRATTGGARLVLLTTRATLAHTAAAFRRDDVLLLGSESRGAPPYVHAAADLHVRIPLMPGRRSLNVAVAAGIALGEALRQTGGLPG